MTWAIPRHSRGEINRAGRFLAGDTHTGLSQDQALEIINNWRSAHAFPLNTLQTGLRNKAAAVEGRYLVAQRIKRLASIRAKLQRFPTMNLSQMQDLGGCRAVVSDINQLAELRSSFDGGRMKHRRVNEKDYIDAPAPSGYRGLHMIYSYVSDRKRTYNGLLIEIQLRTELQHAWATAVETVGTFLRQSLKSSQGEVAWLRFFSLMGSVIARLEGSTRVPGTPPDDSDLVGEVRRASADLQVEAKLRAYGRAVHEVEANVGAARYYLLDLSPSEGRVTVTGFGVGEQETAMTRYLEIEKGLTGPGSEAVLVSVESLEKLRAAYPNYFVDSDRFLETLHHVLGLPSERIELRDWIMGQ